MTFPGIGALLVAVILMTVSIDCIGSDSSVSIKNLKVELSKASEKSKPDVLLKLGIEYAYTDSFELGVKYLMQSLHEAKKLQQNRIIASANYYLGDLYLQFDDVIQAQKFFLEAYQQSEKIGYSKMLVFSSAGLGSLYIDSGDWELANNYIHNALLIAKKKGFDDEIPKLLNLLGIINSYKQLPDSAEFYYKSMLDIGKVRPDSLLIGFAYINMADLRMKTGHHTEAISLLNQAMTISSIRKDLKTYAIILANLGESYFRLNMPNQALFFLNESNRIAKRQGYLSIMMNNYKNISETYKANRNFEASLENLLLYIVFKDSILNHEKQKQLQNTQTKSHLEQIERKLIERQQKDKARDMILGSSLIISLLLVIIVIQGYRRFRLRILLQDMERDRMVHVINQKNRDLVSLSMNLSQKRNLISKVKDSIQGINKQKGLSTKKVLKEIKSDFRTDAYVEYNWESFIKHFNDVNPDFFRQLQLRHPDITQSEMKHCAYLKLNLSSKDVAALNNVNMSSVQMARYRLKKKLKLQKTDDLFEYLGTIG